MRVVVMSSRLTIVEGTWLKLIILGAEREGACIGCG